MYGHSIGLPWSRRPTSRRGALDLAHSIIFQVQKVPLFLSGSLIATNMKLLPVWPLLFSFQVALATTTADILSNIANISTALDTFSAAISKGLSIPSSVSYSYIIDHCILPLTINENFTARSSRLCSTMGLL